MQHNKNMKQFFEKHHDTFYAVARIMIGLLFAQHGAQKLFGAFGGNAAELMSLMGAVGIIEFTGGLLIALGLFTRIAAFATIIVMIGAYIKVHIPQGMIPIMNKGELALLFLAAFLIIISHGSGKWALDNYFFKK